MSRTAALAAVASLLPAAAGQSVSSTSVAGLSEAPGPQLLHHNLLVILADDMSVDTLPLYGLDPTVPPDLTPGIDALAAHGVVFVNAYTNPVCSASRAQLLTGEHAHRTGIGAVIETAPVSLALDAVTLPKVLRALAPQPYDTAAFGKWHLQKKYGSALCPPVVQGFDVFGGTLLALTPSPAYCNWNGSCVRPRWRSTTRPTCRRRWSTGPSSGSRCASAPGSATWPPRRRTTRRTCPPRSCSRSSKARPASPAPARAAPAGTPTSRRWTRRWANSSPASVPTGGPTPRSCSPPTTAPPTASTPTGPRAPRATSPRAARACR